MGLIHAFPEKKKSLLESDYDQETARLECESWKGLVIPDLAKFPSHPSNEQLQFPAYVSGITTA